MVGVNSEIVYDHHAVIGDLYWLCEAGDLNIGDVVQFTTDPVTVTVPTGGTDSKYVVQRGCVEPLTQNTLTGAGADDAIGISFSTIRLAAINRYVSVIIHGFCLARACDANPDPNGIQPNTPFKCCSAGMIQDLNDGSLTVLEAANYRMGKTITLVPIERLGTVYLP